MCRLLMRYFGEIIRRQPVSRRLVDGLLKHIYSMTQSFPATAAQELSAMLSESHRQFFTVSSKRRDKYHVVSEEIDVTLVASGSVSQ